MSTPAVPAPMPPTPGSRAVAAAPAGTASLDLTGIQTIATIAETRQRLLDALARSTELRVDCAGVTEADMTLLQVLMAAHLSAERRGGRLSLAGVRRGGLEKVLAEAGYLPRDAHPEAFPFHEDEA